MATLIRQLKTGYKFINEDLADPRTKDFFMIGSMWPVTTIILGYLYFVYIFGPNFMKNRPAYKLERVMQLYNLSQVVICIYIFIKAMDLAWLRNYSIYCEPIDFSYAPRALEICRTVWYYFIIKIIDLLDTVFFLLRKKQSQVTFLHVYHHAGMVFGAWCATKYMAGGHVTFLGTINTFVHIIMYLHYLLTSLKVNTSSWKKHVTQLQLTQFFLIALHYAQLLWTDCGFPKWPAAIMVPQNIFMIIMFGEFYYKEYIKKKPTKPEINGFIAEIPNGKPKEQ